MIDQLNKSTISHAPDETEIESLLGRFQPTPRESFYSRMEKAPWITGTSRKNENFLSTSVLIRKPMLSISILLLFLLLIGISFIPSVQAVARQIFYSFIPAPSDQIEVQVVLSNPGDLFHYSDPDNFNFSIQEIREQAGFVVKEISQIPEGLILVGSRFDPSYNAIIILYQGDNYKLFLTQRPTEKGKDIFSVGSTAQVNQVMIGNRQGEFVSGGWKAISTQTILDTDTPGSQTSINAIWDNSLPQYTLRWQDEGFVYELRTIGVGSPSQSELISLANELK